MNRPEARRILSALAAGADPETGEELPGLANSPRLIDALYLAYIAVLKGAEPTENEVQETIRGPSRPERAGAPWLKEEDEGLIRGRAAGKGLRDLAREHQRTSLAIAMRLHVKGFLISSGAALEILTALSKGEKGAPAPELALTSTASREALKIGIDAILKRREELDTPRPPRRGSRPWTAEEDKILMAEHEAGTPPLGIACILDRTDGAIRTRLRMLRR